MPNRSSDLFASSQEGDRIAVLYDYIEGREPEVDSDIEAIGKQTGQLHNLMQEYRGSPIAHAKPFFIDRYIDLLNRKGFDKIKIRMLSEYGDALWKTAANLPRGFCHGDYHAGNMLRTADGRYVLFDFDAAADAFPVFDVMLICDSTDYFRFDVSGYEKTQRMVERFCTGYTQQRQISDAELLAIYDLIAINHYQLQATIIECLGLDSVGHAFLDQQFHWLMRWREVCVQRGR